MAAKFAEIYVLLGLKKKGFDKGVKSTKSSIKDMGKSFAIATAAIAGTGVAIYAAGKAIYNVGKRGAIVTQTAESFEYLSEKIGLAPDILEQLRKASLGTIDDMTLMSSTATLLAGTSDELGKALGANTPQLLRIAKAANKLNPSLGTTAFMYESIALGIKRASPMILDNLGITVKLGEANEAMAKSIGKSVDALSAEEKQMALLNSVLGESGERLLNQVDGLDASTDSFAQAEVAVANLKDELSELVYTGIQPTVSWFVRMTQSANDHRDSFVALDDAFKDGLITQEEYNQFQWQIIDGYIESKEVVRQLMIREEEHERLLGITGAALWDNTDAAKELSYALIEEKKATEDAIGSTYNFGQAMAEAYSGVEGLTKILEGEYTKALKSVTKGVYELERAKFLMALALGNLTDAQIKENITTLAAIKRMEDLTNAVDDGLIAQDDLWNAIENDGIVTLDEYNKMMGITTDIMGTAEKGIGNFRGEIESFPTAGDKITSSIRTNVIPAIDYLGSSLFSANALAAELEHGLASAASGDYSAKFTLFIETVGEFKLPKQLGPPSPVPPGGTYTPPPTPPKLPPTPKPITQTPLQHGTSFTVPGGFPNDSFFFPMSLSSGEHVEVTPRSEVGQENMREMVNLTIPITAHIYNDMDVEDLALSIAEVYRTRMQ